METYVWVNPDRIKVSGRQITIDGIQLHVEPSPYDMPTGIVGRFSPDEGIFAIEFRYIDEEPAKKEPQLHEGIRIYEGVHSGKILKLTVPVGQPPHDKTAIIALTTRLNKSLEDRSSRHTQNLDVMLNQQIATEVIRDNLGELVGQNYG